MIVHLNKKFGEREREREKFIYHVRTQQIHIQVKTMVGCQKGITVIAGHL